MLSAEVSTNAGLYNTGTTTTIYKHKDILRRLAVNLVGVFSVGGRMISIRDNVACCEKIMSG